MSEQEPTVGRIVHFYHRDYPGKPIAAIITETDLPLEAMVGFKYNNPESNTQLVRLDIRYPGAEPEPWPPYGPYYPHSPYPMHGHWSWPPRA